MTMKEESEGYWREGSKAVKYACICREGQLGRMYGFRAKLESRTCKGCA